MERQEKRDSFNDIDCNGFPIQKEMQRDSVESLSPRSSRATEEEEEHNLRNGECQFPYEAFHPPPFPIHHPPVPIVCPLCCGFGVIPGHPTPSFIQPPQVFFSPHHPPHPEMMPMPNPFMMNNCQSQEEFRDAESYSPPMENCNGEGLREINRRMNNLQMYEGDRRNNNHRRDLAETDSEPDLTVHFGPRTFVPTTKSIEEGLTTE